MLEEILFYLIIFIYGLVIGSFLNVVIYRLPKGENIAVVRSHCMSCGYQLKWYDLIPVFSYLVLGGKCRKCKTRLSIQYPLIELLNGSLYLIVFVRFGVSMDSLLYCLLFSALLALSVIDFRTYEIPVGINYFILVLGLIHLLPHWKQWGEYMIGFLAVSVFLYLLYLFSGGRAIGGGDVKLMAACGLFMGWKLIVLAFLLGCILGAVIHMMRMKISGESHVLAMGPYLSAGIMLTALFGNEFLAWYLGMYV